MVKFAADIKLVCFGR